MKWLVLLSFACSFAQAQGPASYEGADRQEKLVAGAKKEGELVIYTSAQSDDIGAVAKAFEVKYGVKVNLWRAGSEKVLQRAVTEARGARHAVDVIETNGPELEMLHREQVLQAVKSPHLADLIPAARRHGQTQTPRRRRSESTPITMTMICTMRFTRPSTGSMLTR